jgi:hypothetical protein
MTHVGPRGVGFGGHVARRVVRVGSIDGRLQRTGVKKDAPCKPPVLVGRGRSTHGESAPKHGAMSRSASAGPSRAAGDHGRGLDPSTGVPPASPAHGGQASRGRNGPRPEPCAAQAESELHIHQSISLVPGKRLAAQGRLFPRHGTDDQVVVGYAPVFSTLIGPRVSRSPRRSGVPAACVPSPLQRSARPRMPEPCRSHRVPGGFAPGSFVKKSGDSYEVIRKKR